MIDGQAPIVIYVTFDDLSLAKKVAREVIKQRLGACVNVMPGVFSTYEWEGGVEEGEEVLMLIKTLKNKEAVLIQLISDLHSYDEPAIMSFPVVGGADSFLKWARGQVS